jgi:predicted AlkP superfamily pyrophosphatase or phosphodiesterase
MKIKYLISFLSVFFVINSAAQRGAAQNTKNQIVSSLPRPKLVIGIVVDQMRYDYLFRYYDKYGNDGFKRLMNDGFNCRNHQYHYSSTSTGAGHASIYSGSSPSIHGIIGNSWFDRVGGEEVNCVGDSTVEGIGSRRSAEGKRSPKNLLVTTMTDQLRIATNFRSKTISIALKDRASILPGGHSANAAYWFDGSGGNWITSSYYRPDLPQWLIDFNAQKLPSKYLRQDWETLLPIEKYTESTADDAAYEAPVLKNKKAVFPHELAGQAGNLYGLMSSTPWGNTLTKEMAIAAVKGENLGKGPETDFLAISFSPPDAVGHAQGIHSIEQQDLYLRLDREIADLLNFMDRWVGKDSYTLFLSADHGAMDVPEFLTAHKIPAGRIYMEGVYDQVKKRIAKQFGDAAYITAIQNRQIYLNNELLVQRGVSRADILTAIRHEILLIPGITDVIDSEKLSEARLNTYQRELFLNDLHTKRSGDMQIIISPGWINKADFGTSHGSGYNYDTQVPLLLYGWGIQRGETTRRTYISDIAPTISSLLNILAPSGSIGNVVTEALKTGKNK